MKPVIRQLYKSIPYKKPIFQLLKSVCSPSERVYRHLHFEGVFDVPIDSNHRFKIRHYGFHVENELFWEGVENCHERLSTKLWISLAREARTIFDIGANTGVYSLIAKCVNPGAKVFAFEPVRRVYDKLCANQSLNEYDTFCIEAAVSNSTGTAVIFDLPTEHVYSVTVGKNLHTSGMNAVPKEVSTIRLDDFFDSRKLTNIDLMKIDVETHEPEVLEGLGGYLRRFRPTILIEILNDEVGARVQRLVQQNNYLYFNIDDRKDSFRETSRLERSDLYNYLLCSQQTARELKLK